MKKPILIFILIFISCTSFSQEPSKVLDSAMKVSEEALNIAMFDSTLNIPHPVSVNHRKYYYKSMEMILNKQDSIYAKIIEAKYFTSIMVEDKACKVKDGDPKSIYDLIQKVRESFPANVSLCPDDVSDYFLLGDDTHIEWWNFKNQKGEDCKLGIDFTNGQIVTIYFKI